MKNILFCLVVFALVGLSLANEDLDHHLRGDFRKSKAVSVVSSGTTQHVFARGVDGRIYYNRFDSTSWVGWTALGDAYTTFIGAPSAVSWGPGRLDVFAVDSDNQLRHNAFNGVTWLSTWVVIGSSYLPTVSSVSANIGQLSVFVQDLAQNGFVWTWSGTWTKLQLSARVDAPLVAVSWGINRIDVVTVLSGKLQHAASTNGGSTFSPFSTILSTLNVFGTPSITSWSSDRLDILLLDGGANARHIAWSGAAWGTNSLGGVYSSDMSAVSWAVNRLDYFALGSDSTIYWRYWSGSSFSAETQVSGTKFISAPTASTGGNQQLALFGINKDGQVSWATFNGVTLSWNAFSTIGTEKFLA